AFNTPSFCLFDVRKAIPIGGFLPQSLSSPHLLSLYPLSILSRCSYPAPTRISHFKGSKAAGSTCSLPSVWLLGSRPVPASCAATPMPVLIDSPVFIHWVICACHVG
ncbi:unnamed protein product, partial [Chrysoparadoxa australica]